MYQGKKIAVVIPAYNEQRLIKPTLENVPKLIDKVYVVDDASSDSTPEVVREIAQRDNRIELIRHKVNQGPGQAIINGYKRSSADGYDIAVVVGGDFQMPLEQVTNFLDPLIKGNADYVKGNRFMMEGNAFEDMPKIRLIGNTIISLLTKISSGCYRIFDVVDGYTAITKTVIDTVNWNQAWKRYGYPMDFLARINAYGFRIKDVPRRAIYLTGERQTQIKGLKYALKVSPMLIRNFFWRLNKRYIFSDFHPLVFLYYGGLILVPAGIAVGIYIIVLKLAGVFPSGATAIFCALLLNIGIQSLFFAILFDMMEEK
ncbi:MAG: glycosyltransferase family 2 protein [Candidatus Omnitrophota bacterium]